MFKGSIYVNFQYFQSPTENPYLVLVWRHPDELLDKDYPPDDLQVGVVGFRPLISGERHC